MEDDEELDDDEDEVNDSALFDDNDNADTEEDGNTDDGEGNDKPIVTSVSVISIIICGSKWLLRVTLSNL